MRRGRRNEALSRAEQVRRALSKIEVKAPTPKGAPVKKVPINPGLVVALSRYADRTSDRVLAWAAREAMKTHFRHKKFATEFVLGFGQVLDWAETALVLSPDGERVTRVNLLSMSAQEAWDGQALYHDLLSRVVEGVLRIPDGWTGAQTGAAIGVSPSALRQINARGVENKRAGTIWVANPGPLKHRYVLADYGDGFAWVWIQPGLDKDRVGRAIGLCIASGTYWDDRMQFALVDGENRPWAVLTMHVMRQGRSVPKPNTYLKLRRKRGDPLSGKVTLDLGKLLKDQTFLVWGECKGRFNKRPIPDPHRRYAVALMTSGILGPVQLASTQATAAADLSSLLLVGLTVKKALPLWKKSGGHQTVFSIAAALRPQAMGDGGPNEMTDTYFEGDSIQRWLDSALAPLLLAASTDEQLERIWSEYPTSREVRGEILRTRMIRKEVDSVFWYQATAVAIHQKIPLPHEHVVNFRRRAETASRATRSLKDAAIVRLIRKQIPDTRNLSTHDLMISAIDRGLPVMLKPDFVFRMLAPGRDLTVNALLALTIDRYQWLLDQGGDVDALNRVRAKTGPITPYSEKMSLRYLALVAESLSYASAKIASLEASPEEIAEWGADDYGETVYLAQTMADPDEGWHCANCFGMNEETVAIAISLWDLGSPWGFWSSDLESELILELLGYEQNALDQVDFYMPGDSLTDLLAEDEYGVPPLFALTDEWGEIKTSSFSPDLAAALTRFKMKASELGVSPTITSDDLLQDAEAAYKSPRGTALGDFMDLRKMSRSMINLFRREAGMPPDPRHPIEPLFNRVTRRRRR